MTPWPAAMVLAVIALSSATDRPDAQYMGELHVHETDAVYAVEVRTGVGESGMVMFLQGGVVYERYQLHAFHFRGDTVAFSFEDGDDGDLIRCILARSASDSNRFDGPCCALDGAECPYDVTGLTKVAAEPDTTVAAPASPSD